MPCAEIRTRSPFFTRGTISLFQNGMTLAIVSFRDSDDGIAADSPIEEYRFSNLG